MPLITYWFLRTLSWLVNLFPAKFSENIARLAGNLMFYILPGRRRVAINNLTIAYGDRLTRDEKLNLAKRSFEHIAISFMEVFRIEKLLEGNIEEMFEIKGLEHFEQALSKNKGAIFIVSHIGSWEYLSFLFYLTKFECSALVKKIRNKYIFKWLNAMRLQTTLTMIRKENARNALKTMFRELSNNRIVAVLMDQWAGNDEPWVDFFGKPASTTSIPARLALKTGCALIAGACIRKSPGKYEITIYPEVAVNKDSDDRLTITKKLNELLEAQIYKNPEQWIWTHKRWKGKKKYL